MCDYFTWWEVPCYCFFWLYSSAGRIEKERDRENIQEHSYGYCSHKCLLVLTAITIDYVNCVAFTNDVSKLASCSMDGIICIINLKKMEPMHIFEKIHQGDVVFCVAFTADGKMLATGGEDLCIKLIDVESGFLIYSFDNAHNS